MALPTDIAEHRFSLERQSADSTAAAISQPLPKMWVGFAFLLLYWVLRLPVLFPALSSAPISSAQQEKLSLVILLIRVSCWSYWLFCVYRIHKVLAKVTAGTYPIGPRKAVGFLLIPFFNILYWNFKWTRQIAFFVNKRSPQVKVGRVWPGTVLFVAGVSGIFFDPGIRILMIFSVGLYLTRRIGQVVRPTEKASVSRSKEPLSLSISAGVGAAFAFILAQAVSGFPTIEHKREQLMAVVLVSLGLMWFIEPVADKLRLWFGLAEDHPPLRPRRPMLFNAAVFGFLVLMSLIHALLHDQIRDQPGTTGLVLLMGLLASGGITYAWIIGAQAVPRRSAKKGLIGGAMVGVFLLSPAGLNVANPILGRHAVTRSAVLVSQLPGIEPVFGAKGPAPAPSPQTLAQVKKPATRPLHPLLWAIACPLFGLAGGFAIDRTRNRRMLRNLAFGLILSAVIIILIGWFGPRAHPDVQVCTDIVCFVCGWWLGLVVYPSVESMLVGPMPLHPAPADATGAAA